MKTLNLLPKSKQFFSKKSLSLLPLSLSLSLSLPTHLQAENSSSETPLLVVGTTTPTRYMTVEVVTAHK